MNRKSTKKSHPGFTLVELLLAISIMAVLATMSLALMRSATEDAKESATLARISKIEAMLQLELENYEVRRLPINRSILEAAAVGPPQQQLLEMRDLKRRIIADIINTEMPRPYFDATRREYKPLSNITESVQIGTDLSPPPFYYPHPNSGLPLSLGLEAVPPAGVQRWNSVKAAYPSTQYSSEDTSVPRLAKFDLPAEYLYEILSRIDYDGTSGIESLGNAAVGDTDGDGIFEVIDSWGEPMVWRIVQVIVGSEDSTDWNNWAPVTLIPEGYELLNPSVPRDISQIRFQILSANLYGVDPT